MKLQEAMDLPRDEPEAECADTDNDSGIFATECSDLVSLTDQEYVKEDVDDMDKDRDQEDNEDRDDQESDDKLLPPTYYGSDANFPGFSADGNFVFICDNDSLVYAPSSTTLTPVPSVLYLHSILRIPASSESDFGTGTDLLPICRVCHLPGDDIDPLFHPCRCSGTVEHIHYACLEKWLEVKRSKKPPKCELCQYQYHRHKKFKFHNWKVPRVSRRDKCLHSIFFINLIIMVTCAVATVMCFLSDRTQLSKTQKNNVDLTAEEIITLSCGVVFFVSFFIAMSVEIKAKHTIYKLFVKLIMQNMEWEIDEYDKQNDILFNGPVVSV